MRAAIIAACLGSLVAGCEAQNDLRLAAREGVLGSSACQVFISDDDDRAELYEFARTHDALACDDGKTVSLIVPEVAGCEEGFDRFPRRLTIAMPEASRLLRTCNAAFEPQPSSGRHSAVITLSRPVDPQAARDFNIRLQDLALRVPFGSRFIWGEGGFYCFQFDDKPAFAEHFDEVRDYLPDDATVAYREGGVCQSQHLIWSSRSG